MKLRDYCIIEDEIKELVKKYLHQIKPFRENMDRIRFLMYSLLEYPRFTHNPNAVVKLPAYLSFDEQKTLSEALLFFRKHEVATMNISD